MAAAKRIACERLTLVALDTEVLSAMLDGRGSGIDFDWPAWWPDDVDRGHLAVWLDRAAALGPHSPWRPYAVVERERAAMVGHAGFHLPPASIDAGLADPSFVGVIDPVDGGVVELGYTIFPAERGRGLATEAVTALVDFAFASGEVGAVLAAIGEQNAASLAVIQRIGGFRMIGRCKADEGSTEVVLRRDRRAV